MTFQPRPYQAATKAAVFRFWEAGKKLPCVVAPTGAGKTEMAKMILSEFTNPLAIVHTNTLFEQTVRRMPNVRVYTIQSLLAPGAKADARRQALARHDVAWFDECHHVGGLEWRQALTIPWLPARRFGVTATPMRADGTALGDMFDCMHVSAQYSELKRDGFLVPCDVERSDIKRKDQRKNKVRPDGVEAYLTSPKTKRVDGSWRPGIHFEVTVEACESAVQRYNEAGVRAILVCASTTGREAIFKDYTTAKLDMLVSPTVLAEGFDSPRAEVCVLRRSCDNAADFLQRVGRVLRPFPGKDRGLLIDICNATEKHGLPTDDRVYSLEGKGIAVLDPEKPPVEGVETEDDGAAPTPYRVVQARYIEIRDTLLGRYRDLQAQAAELDYKAGWVWHRFTEATSINPPRTFEARYASVCVHCRHRLKVGETMFWEGPQRVFHEECWFRHLDGTELDKASEALQHAVEWRPSRERLSRATQRASVPPEQEDDIPF